MEVTLDPLQRSSFATSFLSGVRPRGRIISGDARYGSSTFTDTGTPIQRLEPSHE